MRCGFHPRRWTVKRWRPTPPAFWRWLDRAAGVRAEKTRRDSGRTVYGAGKPLRLAALSGGDRSRRQRQKYHGRNSHPAGREDNATSATIETLESPRERAALTGFSLIRLPDQGKNGAATVPDSRPSPAAMRCPLTRNTGMHTPRISRR